jgi:hypothetical protein
MPMQFDRGAAQVQYRLHVPGSRAPKPAKMTEVFELTLSTQIELLLCYTFPDRESEVCSTIAPPAIRTESNLVRQWSIRSG